ncbi:ABC transporter permease [Enterococcus rivorum]|uniref:Multidrug ABC transporter permease n=1 Tax=Enterococcus rivorum TaxID=762845 RepID=A0A1E5KU98_9ENTE|nr:ABC-2 family transporter protein [Enterococcus rivorum]MBP2098934.1 ABC-2 type transport system permease protein [Enterococcus rivorum]OEH81467.1 multidrug ABC transporter permease [Enterococcus rivorum]
MKRAFKLEKVFIKQYLKQLMEYKGDFLVGVIGMFLTQGLNLLFLNIIFKSIPTLNGWTLKQIAFIYGFSLIPKGLDHLFFDNLWSVGQQFIKTGEFDKYLIRPINPLLHVLIEKFCIDAFGELIIGISLLAITTSYISWSAVKFCLFLITIPFTTIIYTSLKVIAASMAFRYKQAGSVMYIFYMINDFSKYPVSIYNNSIKFIITFVIPFAFAGYYPASFFLTNENILFNIGGVIIISLTLLGIALIFWKKGILKYESTGS